MYTSIYIYIYIYIYACVCVCVCVCVAAFQLFLLRIGRRLNAYQRFPNEVLGAGKLAPFCCVDSLGLHTMPTLVQVGHKENTTVHHSTQHTAHSTPCAVTGRTHYTTVRDTGPCSMFNAPLYLPLRRKL